MKSYEEVAKSVFEKSEKYFVQKWHRQRRIKIALSTLSCICLAAVAVGAVMHSDLIKYPESGEPSAEGQYTSDANTPADTDSPDGTAAVPDNYNYIWQTSEEIIAEDDCIVTYGSVDIGTLLVYDGALYTIYSPEDEKADRYYALTGNHAYFFEWFPCEAYAVKNEPDTIAIKLDFAMFEYRKLFDCDIDIDGEKFTIAYQAYMGGDYNCGGMVLQTEDFTVYEAVRLQGNPTDTKEYIVNLTSALQMGLSDILGNVWWIVVPDNVTEELTHNGSSLSANTLSDVTPKDTDRILAAAQAAITETLIKVYVPAEKGSEVYSLVDGVVVWADEQYWKDGYSIYVDTEDGQHQVLHSHLSEMLVEVGDTVTKGQVIGLAGSIGGAAYGAGYKCFELIP